ncbi:MAG: hypothetical protein WCS03_16155 [Bacteroidota bacterium]
MKSKFNLVIVSFPLLLLTQLIYSQDLVKSTGTAQMELTDDKSRLALRKELQDLATIDALQKAFGVVVIEGNSSYVKDLQTGDKVQTNSVFNSISNTSVKGEVQSIISARFSDTTDFRTIDGKKNEFTTITCEIEILAREIITPKITFTSFPLGCLDEKCRTTEFKNEDNLYLFFSTPMSGYLTVYLDDSEYSQCLYPHPGMTSDSEGGVPVVADKKYFLFSDVNYSLFAKSLHDMNRLFVIFSITPLNKPFLKDVSQKILDEKEYKKGVRLPKSLSSEDFQRWLNSYRSIGRDNVQVEIVDITITK